MTGLEAFSAVYYPILYDSFYEQVHVIDAFYPNFVSFLQSIPWMSQMVNKLTII
ncbi:MAG: hypothetical protein O2964_09935 [Verrucomicrobia bacterium]|nr:hypothetical protein [Verrucomicrobiota bacterium]